ncbi:MAG: ParB N-terminal domain-containing protein [Oscillospiraceae bacterium]|nr:ParB N-terminal domain-containing protein [Oscillospiraceae bacterium]
MSKLNKLASRAKKTKPAAFTEETIRNFTQKIDDVGQVETVAVSKIRINPANDYRDRDNEDSIRSLAEDISRQGLLHNLVVSEKEENGSTYYLLISGERRLRAIRMLTEREVEKAQRGEAADPGRFRTVNCRVVKGLSDRREMIMLDAANLQTRGGAGDEAATRKAMVRYRENVMAEYGLTEEQVREIIVDMSPVGLTTVNSNFIIEDSLRAELKNLLDSNEINKKQALGFAKLSQLQQKLVSDSVNSLKEACARKSSDYSEEVKKAVKGFFEATEEKADKKVAERLEKTAAEVRKTVREMNSAGKAPAKPPVRKAQRDMLLADCDAIAGKIARLSTQKAVANIRRFDAAAEEEGLKISGRIAALIEELQSLYRLLEADDGQTE